MKLVLDSPEQALEFGQMLASCLCQENCFPPILFQGELGVGKTTIIRGIVAGLPHGDEAEVSSPSFNIVNIYPTKPEVAHFDLYRLQACASDQDADAMEEYFFSDQYLVLMEWSEYMPDYLWPENYLLISLSYHTKGREMDIIPKGIGEKIYSCLKKVLKE
ncbi:tRNA (adenosine(37)-N6)-threonylcarbamoyltransferase complex ATPase subunit type 1 TsaE [Desulfovulcanus sp.]